MQAKQADRQWGARSMLLISLVAVAAAVIIPLSSQAMPAGQGGSNCGPGGMVGVGGPGMMMMGAGDPAHMNRMLDRMLGGLDVTEAQRTQIQQIVQSAASEMQTQRDAGRSLREQAAQIMAAPVIDAAAAESLRQQMLAMHDQSSKRMLQTMIDIGNVLTPEQRAQLAERMKQRGTAMHQHRRGQGSKS